MTASAAEAPRSPRHLSAVALPPEIPAPEIAGALAELEGVAKGLETHTLSPETRRAYMKGWRSFESFCTEHSMAALPAHPEAVRLYVAWMASAQKDDGGGSRYSISSVRQHLAAIAERHLREGHMNPTTPHAVSDLVKGLARQRGARPRRERPLLLEDVREIIAVMELREMPAAIAGARDSLALWLGFIGALRRSEAAGLTLGSVLPVAADGIHLRIGQSKTDQENTRPDVVVLPYGSTPATCGPCALHRWSALVKITDERGPGPATSGAMAHLLDDAAMSMRVGAHVCGHESEALVASEQFRGSAPLLRATFRNRRGGRIHGGGITGDALHQMLLRRMREAEVDTRNVGFHSLRAGFVTQARRAGADPAAVRRQTRHSSDRMVDVYDREWAPLARNAVTWLGL